MDPFQQFEQRLRDEPQPTVINGQIQVRSNSCHFVLDFRANPQGAVHRASLTRLNQYRLRFIADSGDAVTQISGIEVVGTVVMRDPRRREILLQHRHPTTFRRDVQVFVIGNGIELVFLVLLVRRGVRRAAEGVQCEVAASGIEMRWQSDGLLQLTKGGDFQRFLASVLHVVVDVDSVITTFQDKRFGKRVACRVGIRHRHLQFVLTFSQHISVFFNVIQRTRAVSRVIRAITTGQTALCLINKLR